MAHSGAALTTESAEGERYAKATTWEGETAVEWAAALGLSQVVLFDQVASTMDVAHDLAIRDARAGTLVLSDRQTAGRGRGGRAWVSRAGDGIWMTSLERPTDVATVQVWALRMGVCMARALDSYSDAPIRLKWPNDLYAGTEKVAGILVEARWQDQRIQWVAVGIGINVRKPDTVAGAGALRAGTSRADVLRAIVPALRSATSQQGVLTPTELREFAARDLAKGRQCREPAVGRVDGIGDTGELLIVTAGGTQAYRTGSLVLDEERDAR